MRRKLAALACLLVAGIGVFAYGYARVHGEAQVRAAMNDIVAASSTFADVDYGAVTVEPFRAGATIRDVSISWPSGAVHIDEVRLSRVDVLNSPPHYATVELSGVSDRGLMASAQSLVRNAAPGGDTVFPALDWRTIRYDLAVAYAFDPDQRGLAVTDLTIVARGIGTFSCRIELSHLPENLADVSRATLEDPMSVMMQAGSRLAGFGGILIHSAAASYRDETAINLALDAAARRAGQEPRLYYLLLKDSVKARLARTPPSRPLQHALTAAAAEMLEGRGMIDVTLSPGSPVAIARLIRNGFDDQALHAVLHIAVSTAGQRDLGPYAMTEGEQRRVRAGPSLAAARAAAEAGRLTAGPESALSLYRDALKIDPDNRDAKDGIAALPRLLIAQAARERELGHLVGESSAADLLQQALALAPDNQEAATALAGLVNRLVDIAGQRSAQGRFAGPDGALTALRQALSLDPKHAGAGRALSLLPGQIVTAAKAAQDRGRVTDPDQGAIALYKQALELDPDNAAARQGISDAASHAVDDGLFELAAGHYAAARAALGQAAAIQPDLPALADLRSRLAAFFAPGRTFQDCAHCPEMTVLPAGDFMMGLRNRDAEAEPVGWREKNAEQPLHLVQLPSFAIGTGEITVGQFRAFVEATGYQVGSGCHLLNTSSAAWTFVGDATWQSPGGTTDETLPAVCISWKDASSYVRWLAYVTGQPYRLPSEAEWEFAARGGSDARRFWGESALQQCSYANGADISYHAAVPNDRYYNIACDDRYVFLAPTRDFLPNQYGLYDMIGNADEWTQDCWHEGYQGAPTDETPWQSDGCGYRVARGGSWMLFPAGLRSNSRVGYDADRRASSTGFRVALTVAAPPAQEPETPEAASTRPAATQEAAATPAVPGGKVNVYNWSDYIGEHTNENFAKATGIAVTYDVFDSNETLEAKLLAGKTDYDVVVPSSSFIGRQRQAGVFRKLDKSKLPNLSNIDPIIMQATEAMDPGHVYSVPYFWGTVGIGYNVDKIKALMPDAPVDSWDLILKPDVVARFKDCGVTMLDAPGDVLQSVLIYLGKDPHSDKPEDYAEAQRALAAVRPYIRYFHSSSYINDIANGEICLAIGWNGDFQIAKARAAEAGNGVNLRYVIPKEGTLLWADVLAIPADAANVEAALMYINNMLDPRVAADNANYVHYASPNKTALDKGLIDDADTNNPAIYPPADIMARLKGDNIATPQLDQLRTRTWAAVKTGR